MGDYGIHTGWEVIQKEVVSTIDSNWVNRWHILEEKLASIKKAQEEGFEKVEMRQKQESEANKKEFGSIKSHQSRIAEKSPKESAHVRRLLDAVVKGQEAVESQQVTLGDSLSALKYTVLQDIQLVRLRRRKQLQRRQQ